VIAAIKRGYRFPKLAFWHSYEWAKDRLVGTGNVRNEVIERIRIGRPDFDRPYGRLEHEQEILRNILIVCRYYGIRTIVGSYPFYAYSDDLRTRRMAEGVARENELLRALADEVADLLVDQAALVDPTPENFLDWVHFTPEGMRQVARNFAEAIAADLGHPDASSPAEAPSSP
jgi:hypothetical protein